MKRLLILLLLLCMCFAAGCTAAPGASPDAEGQEGLTQTATDALGGAPSQEAANTPDAVSTEPGGTELPVYPPTIILDAPWYAYAEDLDEAIDGVLLCRVTGESYRVYAGKGGDVMTDILDESRSPLLNTVYSVEPIACFKGDFEDVTELSIPGAADREKNVEEIMEACGVTDPLYIQVFTGKQPEIEIGKLYVFAVSDRFTPYPRIYLRNQSVFPLEGDPDGIQCDGIYLKDLIALYGEDAWNTVKEYCSAP